MAGARKLEGVIHSESIALGIARAIESGNNLTFMPSMEAKSSSSVSALKTVMPSTFMVALAPSVVMIAPVRKLRRVKLLRLETAFDAPRLLHSGSLVMSYGGGIAFEACAIFIASLVLLLAMSSLRCFPSKLSK